MESNKSLNSMRDKQIAVVFLARGYEDDHIERFERFKKSYSAWPSGIEHNLHVIFKGFADQARERTARSLFSALPHIAHQTDDFGFDIGAYSDILNNLSEDFVCFFNSHAEIQSEYWLKKLIDNLDCSAVGMVSASGSYESLNFIHADFPKFPNPHLRTNAFGLRLKDAREFFPQRKIRDKLEAWRFESGAEGLTQLFWARGLACLIVGRDGCGYGPDSWPQSETYRSGLQSNLLVGDNVTRTYPLLSHADRTIVVNRTWGFFAPATIIQSDGRPRR
jgi:hypothetical protein